MALRTGRVIIARNIKLDKSYKNVIDYTEANMLNLVIANKVSESTSCSFLKPGENVIDTSFTYSDCLKCNYLALQNPSYSNKWFFAFIDEVEYINNGTTRIHYTIDIYSTWFDYIQVEPTFVIREHVNDDTIGLHTVPENLELGDYTTCQACEKMLEDPADYYICMAVSELPDGSFTPNSNHRTYNGIFGGFEYLVFKTEADCENAIKMYDKADKIDAVIYLFMIPKDLTAIQGATQASWTMSGIPNVTVYYLAGSTDADTIGTLTGTRPTKLGNNFIPKNNKLFTYPYSFINLTNNSGQTIPFRYEDFDYDENDTTFSFWIDATISPGMSMKAIPLFYKHVNVNYNYGVMLGKLPVCSWNSDVYINWLTENALNTTLTLVGEGVGLAASLATGNAVGAVMATTSIINTINQVTIAEKTPNQARGSTNGGDVNFSESYDGGVTLYYMSVKDEYAKIIDDYFTMRGYKINSVKTPNLTGRTYYNYVQIAEDADIGYPNSNLYGIPASDMEEINNIYRRGVTIWHNHANIGNYALDNAIVNN